jgi:membrane-bound ClpP family serine protease
MYPILDNPPIFIQSESTPRLGLSRSLENPHYWVLQILLLILILLLVLITIKTFCMGILTLAVIAAGILVVVFVIRRVASSNSGTGSRSQFSIENADQAPLHFNLNILDVAKENKKHQDQTRRTAEEFQKRSREFQKQAADAAERARKNFEEGRKRNENMHKQIEETNKVLRNMWG